MKKSLLTLLLVTASSLAAALPAHCDDYPLKTCVVTGDAFGGDLGPPIDLNYKGHKVRLCCKSCVKKFNANPEKYLAMIGTGTTAKDKK